jgi:hypothetical protein
VSEISLARLAEALTDRLLEATVGLVGFPVLKDLLPKATADLDGFPCFAILVSDCQYYLTRNRAKITAKQY